MSESSDSDEFHSANRKKKTNFLDDEAEDDFDEEDVENEEAQEEEESSSESPSKNGPRKSRNRVVVSDEEDEDEIDRRLLEQEGKDDMFIDDQEEEDDDGSSDEASAGRLDSKRGGKKTSQLAAENSQEEGESSSEEDVGKKKRKRIEKDEDLSEDEYDLLEENLGYKVERKTKKTFKRLKKKTNRAIESSKDLEKELFEDEDMIHEARSASEPEDPPSQESEIDFDEEEDDVEDFIVDNQGETLRKKKHKQKGSSFSSMASSAMREAQEIFGDDFLQYQQGAEADDGEFDEEEEEEDDDDDFIERDDSEKRKVKKKSKSNRHTVQDIFEPALVEKKLLGDFDEEIRVADYPERMKIRNLQRASAEFDDSLEEASWIYDAVFGENAQQPIQSLHQSTSAGENPSASMVPDTCDDWESGEVSHSDHAVVSSSSSSLLSSASLIPRIQAVIEYLKAGYEIPFIGVYRKEDCYMVPEAEDDLFLLDTGRDKFMLERRLRNDLLNFERLWKIYDWDEKWIKYSCKKQSVKRLLDNLICAHAQDASQTTSQPSNPEENQDPEQESTLLVEQVVSQMSSVSVSSVAVISENDLRRVQEAKSIQDVKDISAWITLNFSPVLLQISKSSSHKKPMKRTFYSVCLKAGLLPFLKSFGLSPEEFSKNLSSNYNVFSPPKLESSPEHAAEDYLCGAFPTLDIVLKAARIMYATQLASDNFVRKTAREIFFEKALVSTFPTPKGISISEESTEFISMYISFKPLSAFQNDEFLTYLKLQKDGLLTIVVDFEMGDQQKRAKDFVKSLVPIPSFCSTTVQQFYQLFILDDFSSATQLWNEQRMEVISSLVKDHFIPLFQSEILAKLESEAHARIKLTCQETLQRRILHRAFRVVESEADDEIGESCSPVMACKVGDRDTPTFFANLDGNGEVTDFLRLDFFTFRVNSKNPREAESKRKDMSTFVDFLSRKHPAGIVIGADSQDSFRIVYPDIMACVEEAIQLHNIPQVEVHMMETDISRIYEASQRSLVEFPQYPPSLRSAVSIGRAFQDPLAEFSSLCNVDKEIECLHLHPLQHVLPTEDLSEALCRPFMNAVALSGVDCTRIVNYRHTSHTLQFVAGFGLRKAEALLRNLSHTGLLNNRQELITRGLMGQLVFENSSGFLKIAVDGVSHDTYVDKLDETRIHPENYEFARKMAADALEYQPDDNGEYPEQIISEIFETPTLVEDLGLDDYAAEIERKQKLKKRITLYDIKREFFSPFKDYLPPFVPMSLDELFFLLTGETENSLKPGMMHECQVVGLSRAGMNVRLQSGLSGFIPLKLISDSMIASVEERAKVGMVVHCVVQSVDKRQFSVDLSSRSSDLRRRCLPIHDACSYFDFDRSKSSATLPVANTKPKRAGCIKRVIVHPSFKNVSYEEAEKLLEAAEVGDVIIRPSSKGLQNLTVTWKMTHGVYQHIDVREEDKETNFSLGLSLFIGEERFDDLDEILARYIQPMNSFVQDMFEFRYFKKATKSEVEQLLRIEKEKDAARIPYFFTVSEEYVGKFMLSYLPNSRPRHEYVTPTHQGFRFRKNVFTNIEKLVGWFKTHWNDAPKPAPASARPQPQPAFDAHSGYPETAYDHHYQASSFPREDAPSSYRGEQAYESNYGRSSRHYYDHDAYQQDSYAPHYDQALQPAYPYSDSYQDHHRSENAASPYRGYHEGEKAHQRPLTSYDRRVGMNQAGRGDRGRSAQPLGNFPNRNPQLAPFQPNQYQEPYRAQPQLQPNYWE